MREQTLESGLWGLGVAILFPLVVIVTVIILAIVIAPFATGFLAYYQWFGYKIFVIIHILSGEIMLVTIPFSRLSHMITAPLTRAYMGSEFGGVRHAQDW